MTLRVMQVLHQGGGAGSVTSTLHLSIALARRGVMVRLVCPPDSAVEASARREGLEVHPLQLHAGKRRANAAALARLVDKYPVDLINSQSSRDRAALTWLGLTRRLPVPVVFTRRQMPLTFWLENWLASRVAKRVVAVSQAVADALVRRGTPRRKIAVIENGLVDARVDVEVRVYELDHWRNRIGWDPSRRTIGVISRLKDQAVLLRALSRVPTPVRLVLAGVERTDGELAKLADALPQRHAVSFIPFDPNIRPLYDLLDIVLLPSRMEGLSQAVLEAMALGKPVIASAASGNLHLITDGVDGVLVDPLDPAAWADAVNRLLADPDAARALGQAARHTSREKFSLDRTVARTLDLYYETMRAER